MIWVIIWLAVGVALYRPLARRRARILEKKREPVVGHRKQYYSTTRHYDGVAVVVGGHYEKYTTGDVKWEAKSDGVLQAVAWPIVLLWWFPLRYVGQGGWWLSKIVGRQVRSYCHIELEAEKPPDNPGYDDIQAELDKEIAARRGKMMPIRVLELETLGKTYIGKDGETLTEPEYICARCNKLLAHGYPPMKYLCHMCKSEVRRLVTEPGGYLDMAHDDEYWLEKIRKREGVS